MNISYNWLKEYVDFDLTPDEVAAALTSIGLETGSVEEVQTIKGGLEGLVIGEVLTCEAHPNSDHMHITTVNLGQGEPVQIVCGAPNVAAGQKVVVATLGTKLYDGDECFTIKKSKLRGVESVGMICAEDEIGIGTDHAGIIVLPETAVPGTLAKDYYNIKSDYVLEVDITPNRADACSHYGVARDLYAYLIQNGKQARNNPTLAIAIVCENMPKRLFAERYQERDGQDRATMRSDLAKEPRSSRQTFVDTPITPVMMFRVPSARAATGNNGLTGFLPDQGVRSLSRRKTVDEAEELT